MTRRRTAVATKGACTGSWQPGSWQPSSSRPCQLHSHCGRPAVQSGLVFFLIKSSPMHHHLTFTSQFCIRVIRASGANFTRPFTSLCIPVVCLLPLAANGDRVRPIGPSVATTSFAILFCSTRLFPHRIVLFVSSAHPSPISLAAA